MIVVERHHIKPTHKDFPECDMLALVTKNLYNKALWQINDFFYNNRSYVSGTYVTKSGAVKDQWIVDATYIYHQMKEEPEFRTDQHHSYNGKKVNTKVLKQTEKQLAADFSTYFKALKDYNKTPSKYKGRPCPPKYNKKTGRNTVTFPKDAISSRKKKDHIHLGGTDIYVKLHKATKETIKEAKIVPLVYGYDILISYEVKEHEQITKKHTSYAAIDLGINNLATLSFNDTSIKPFIVNGRPVKSINQYYNKKRARLYSELPNNTTESSSAKKLTQKRNMKIHDYMHKTSDYIVDHLMLCGVTCLVVGSNKHWKTGVRLRKKTAQSFVSIPFDKLKRMLEYKCQLVGIEYIEHEESYTSKCSFLDMEPLKRHKDENDKDNYLGKRVRRGLFRSSNGTVINADLNGSLNIMRKVAGNGLFDPDSVEDYAVSPVRVTFS